MSGSGTGALAVIQARTGSSRLPGKVLADLAGKPMLAWVVERTCRARRLGQVMVATSLLPGDDPVEELCSVLGVACFRGSEQDVLDRFYRAAETVRPELVVRITADCPFVDPTILDDGIRFWNESREPWDYLGLPAGYPEGVDAEFFSFAVLAEAWAEARLPAEREHVTPFLYTHDHRYKVGRLPSRLPEGTDASSMRWSVDRPRDLEFARELFRRLAPRNRWFTMEDVLAVLEREPELLSIRQAPEPAEEVDRG